MSLSDGPGFHNRQNRIPLKIRSLLISLTRKPSEYGQITPKIEYWIEYVLREHFTTVDELVEGVSYVAWENGGSYASVARFLKEFRDAPHRSEQARSFIAQLCFHILRWFAIASVECLEMGWFSGPTSIASGGGDGFIRAASFVGHLIECGLLSHELVRQHLIKPLTHHHDGDTAYRWEPVRANAIYQLFIAAGNTLFQGLLEPEDVQLCFETLDAQSKVRKVEGYDAARVKVWWTTHAEALQRYLTYGSGTSRDSHRLVAAERRRRGKGRREDTRTSDGRRGGDDDGRGPCRV
jgi:hypothetical protein